MQPVDGQQETVRCRLCEQILPFSAFSPSKLKSKRCRACEKKSKQAAAERIIRKTGVLGCRQCGETLPAAAFSPSMLKLRRCKKCQKENRTRAATKIIQKGGKLKCAHCHQLLTICCGFSQAMVKIKRCKECVKQKRYPYRKHRGVLDEIQGLVCFGCFEVFSHKRHLVIDHKIPQTGGGSDDLDNLQLLCSSCNSIKGHQGSMEDLRHALECQFDVAWQLNRELRQREECAKSLV